MENLQIIKKQVEYVLENNADTRNSDKLLQVIVLQKFYNVRTITDILKPNIPSLESIRRCRQKLQEEGKFPATKKTRNRRKELQQVYEEFAVTGE